MENLNALLPKLIEVAREAGRAIMQVYGTEDFGVETKSDSSPVTKADKAAHAIIGARLAALTPDVPIISEEGGLPPYSERQGWRRFYLVDPLDGTKEFIKRNGEFTVNIALIEDRVPVLGVIYIPVTGRTFYAARGAGAWRVEGDGAPVRIHARPAPSAQGPVLATSRSHGSEKVEKFVAALNVSERIPAGSSVKLCLVAEGRADIYPRFGPTWEWDVAAGHAIMSEAGGLTMTPDGARELRYNKDTLKQEGFIAMSSARVQEKVLEVLAGLG